MILLDTNIISEMMRPLPSTQVIRWINQQKSMYIFVSTVTIAEISYGLQALPRGKRRMQLEHAFNQTINRAFENRILSFDLSAAYWYGKIMALRKSSGRPLGVPDGQIAAIAGTQGFALATRNGRDFISCGLEIINPFD